MFTNIRKLFPAISTKTFFDLCHCPKIPHFSKFLKRGAAIAPCPAACAAKHHSRVRVKDQKNDLITV